VPRFGQLALFDAIPAGRRVGAGPNWVRFAHFALRNPRPSGKLAQIGFRFALHTSQLKLLQNWVRLAHFGLRRPGRLAAWPNWLRFAHLPPSHAPQAPSHPVTPGKLGSFCIFCVLGPPGPGRSRPFPGAWVQLASFCAFDLSGLGSFLQPLTDYRFLALFCTTGSDWNAGRMECWKGGVSYHSTIRRRFSTPVCYARIQNRAKIFTGGAAQPGRRETVGGAAWMGTSLGAKNVMQKGGAARPRIPYEPALPAASHAIVGA